MREKILNYIERNSRIELHDLAVMLDAPEADVMNELEQMEAEGVICGYHTLINWEKAGIEKVTAMIEVRVTLQRGMEFDQVAERIYNYPEVNSVYLISGGFDFMVTIEGKTLREVSEFVSDKLSSMDAVLSTKTNFILKKYKDHMSLLYKAYETFKDELTSVLNHPLMPSEFESAWHELMDKYNLQNDEIMKALWTDRKEWISAYYEVFCARMTSTQRSESTSRILKRNFVKEIHDLHIFASQVDRCIQTRKGVEHVEIIANEVYNQSKVFKLDEQLIKHYSLS